jgi:putative ABC transport system permease protein
MMATHDLRYGLRALRRDAGFTALVVLILALGIGATTVIFSVVKAVLLDPLPYRDADGLARLWESSDARGVARSAVSVPNFEDWRRHQTSFEQLAASEMATFTLTGTGDAERLAAARITANLLPALGVQPIVGRTFVPADESAGATKVALLGYGVWQRRFGGDRSIVGRSIPLNGESVIVVGVLPVEFDFPTARELWVPLVVDPAREPWRADRSNRNLAVFGRLKAGVSLVSAMADLNRIGATLAAAYPGTNSGWSVRGASFREWLVPGPVRQASLVLFAAVGLLLLLTCANVANLQLARTVGRQREMATHAALGATRTRLVRQLLLESLALALAGGVAGATVAHWGISAINTVAIPDIPQLQHMALDATVLAFAVAVSVATGLVFGLVPAWWTSRHPLSSRLKEDGASIGGPRTQRVRGSLVSLQIGLTVTVVVIGALLVRSFVELQRVPLGFRTGNVLTFQINLPASAYGTPERRVAFYDTWFTRLRAIPGVLDVGASTHPAYAPSEWKVDVTVPGAVAAGQADARPAAVARAVTPGYFQALGIPVRRGGVFTKWSAAPERFELVVSESFARRFWPADDPIGKSFRPGANNPFGVVIGVAGDARTSGGDAPEPAFYFDYAYLGMPSLAVVVRTNDDPERLVPAIRHELRAIDSGQPIYNIRTVEQIVSRATAQPRVQALLVGMLAAAAIALAAFGTYSMITYVVRQRRQEIAVRLAVGATQSDISRMLIGTGLRYALPGTAAGLAGALLFAQVVGSLLFRISPTDVLTFTISPLTVLGVVWMATYWPARRAGRLAPVTLLRNE